MSSPLPQIDAHSSSNAPATPPARKRAKLRWGVTLILVAAAVWIAIDLFGPRSTSLRSFDPDEVARLDTAMWRSYYDKKRARLFVELSELLRAQYRLPFLRSNAVAYQAARAAFVFKGGRNRDDYEKALPNLVSFYAAIRKVGDVPFDVDRAARLELEWWIVHREREAHPPGDLQRALAESAAEVYRVPTESLMQYARLRAEAMTIRDTKAEAGAVTQQDWARIGELLRESWRALWKAVNS